jgi:hypothetical protein
MTEDHLTQKPSLALSHIPTVKWDVVVSAYRADINLRGSGELECAPTGISVQPKKMRGYFIMNKGIRADWGELRELKNEVNKKKEVLRSFSRSEGRRAEPIEDHTQGKRSVEDRAALGAI